MGCTAATPGSLAATCGMDLGNPFSVVVDTVTSDPFVSRASTLACAANVVLNTATASAKDAESAINVMPRDRRLRCLDIDAATTPERRPASGDDSVAIARRPLASAMR